MTDDDLYSQVILEHNKHPKNFGAIEGTKKEGFNPLCGDQITVFVDVKNDKIANIAFTGTGCAISKASASMMTQSLKGKTISQAKELFKEFTEMITQKKKGEHLGKLEIFSGIHNYPARAKCATLCWHTFKEAVE